MPAEFDYTKADTQGTSLEPISIGKFDIEAYADYEGKTFESCRHFLESPEGISVYRRFRIPEVFSWGCRDRQMSLEWQLAALDASKDYAADIPNFLEPWFGIGVVSSSFGVEYEWQDGQAPAVRPQFRTAREAIDHLQCPVSQSHIGREVIERIEYYLDTTHGKIPMSLSDTQSPLNIVSSYILDPTSFMYEMFDHPDDLKELLSLVADLESKFIKEQINLIGPALASPGHGFASSREFRGLGFSDDNSLMFSDSEYRDFALPYLLRVTETIDSPVFHSCGNWSERSEFITSIPNLFMADGAVGSETDPDPNDGAALGRAFAEKDPILHVRIVGHSKTVIENANKIWQPGLKLIVATYCESPEDQEKVYRALHELSTDSKNSANADIIDC